jgi:aspartate/methionine/tyrosine aminotransferase
MLRHSGPYQEMLRLDAVNYDPIEMAAVRRRHGLVNMASGICLLPAPTFLVNAATEAASCRSSTDDYDGPAGNVLGRIAVTAWLRAHRVDVDLSNVLITPGVSYGLAMIARHLGRRSPSKKSKAIIAEPTYSSAGQTFAFAGLDPVAVRSSSGLGVPHASQLIDGLTDEIAVVYVNEFNNPTGESRSPEELSMIADAAAGVGAVLVVDAITAELPSTRVGEGGPSRFAALAALVAGREMYVLGGLSKDRSMPGIRAGWIVTDAASAQALSEANLCEQPGSVGIAGPVVYTDRLARSADRTVSEHFIAESESLAGCVLGSQPVLRDTIALTNDRADYLHQENRRWEAALHATIEENILYLRSQLDVLGLILLIEPVGGYNLLVRSRDRYLGDNISAAHAVFRRTGVQLMPIDTFSESSSLSTEYFSTRLSLAMEGSLWRDGLSKLAASDWAVHG